ncbi:MAG: glycosyltransferase family 2 protein [Planctomycetes bacterium]|nr:glycosyltransferase family 2 protein [Planctomycetota bacterium]
MADAAPPRVAVLLLNFRRPELTLRCLTDLDAVAGVELDVLLIDNGSEDDSAARLAAAAGERAACEFLALEHNLGFAGGMNRGIEWAARRGAPFCLVLNNDVRLPSDAIRPLADVLANDPRVAAVGPTVLHPDGTVWAEGGDVGFAPNALRLRRHGRAPAPRERGPEAVGFLPGACVLFRTAALGAVGGFDEHYFMYWEDVDLAARLRASGGRIVWLPWVRVEHESGGSSGGGRSRLRKFLMARYAPRYLRHHGSLAGWAGWAVFDVLLWPLALLTGPRAAWAKLRGTLAGLTGAEITPATIDRLL